MSGCGRRCGEGERARRYNLCIQLRSLFVTMNSRIAANKGVPPVADSTAQPDTDHTEESDQISETTTESSEQPIQETQEAQIASVSSVTPSVSAPTTTIIWTPRFMVIFALTFVFGLSAESLLTQGWLNGFYPTYWVLLAHIALITGCWIAVIVLARSWWVRTGAIFGCIWAIFTSTNLIVGLVANLDPNSPILAHLNAAFSSALLGSYICFSIVRTPFRRWDTWFLRLIPVVSGAIIIVAYFLTPPIERSLSMVESDLAAIALLLCIGVWWLRPSCWKAQPCPTLFFGAVPTILLCLSIPGLANGEANFFLSQVVDLCLLLGAMRVLQGELRN